MQTLNTDSHRLARSIDLRERFESAIPGGAHTYAKGNDQFPESLAPYVVRGHGCHIWDVDGNEYIEYGMGLRSVTLGHAFAPVVEAAHRAMMEGTNFVRPTRLELDCAETLLSIIPGADMVKFAKNGSDVTTAAVKLARAYTGRDKVAICAEHPFFSVDDWFIGTTPMSAGIPKTVSELTVKFHYNDLASVEALFQQYPDQIACVILEPEKEIEPSDDFLGKLHALCQQHRIILIFDETITGFRWHLAGGQGFYGVVPDLSCFGKALGNGFSVAALAGRQDLMELGGINHTKERVFLLSTTHGGETHALAAARATIQTYQKEPVIDCLWRKGERLRDGIGQMVRECGLEGYFEVIGRPCNLVYVTRDRERQPSQIFRTLFLQETIARGILAPSFVVSYSHKDDDVDRTLEIVGEALRLYRRALEEGPGKYLSGRPVKPVFRRFA